jgi:4-hydroxy-4-methyl-2-oxoglutarate aldolase
MTSKIPGFSRRLFLGMSSALMAASIIPKKAQAFDSKQMAGATVSLIADALRKLGENPKDHAMDTTIKPLFPAGRTIIGTAVTMEWQAGKGRGSADDIKEFVFRPLDNASPGSIWVIASGTDKILSMFGDLIGQACKRNGMLGAVTDSGCRDIEAMKAYDFPVFAKASVPYGPGGVIRPVAANGPVVCGGVKIDQDDLIAADIDGVIVVPKALLPKLNEIIASLLEKENKVRARVDAGESLEKSYDL